MKKVKIAVVIVLGIGLTFCTYKGYENRNNKENNSAINKDSKVIDEKSVEDLTSNIAEEQQEDIEKSINIDQNKIEELVTGLSDKGANVVTFEGGVKYLDTENKYKAGDTFQNGGESFKIESVDKATKEDLESYSKEKLYRTAFMNEAYSRAVKEYAKDN